MITQILRNFCSIAVCVAIMCLSRSGFGQELSAVRKHAILPMHAIHSVHHAVSPAVEDLPIQSFLPLETGQVQDLPHHKLSGGESVPRNADSAIQTLAQPPLSATLGLNFDGLGQDEYGFGVAFDPPDPVGAVGQSQYVQWVNQSFAVFNKSTGALVAGPFAGNALWKGFGGGCEADNDGDPIVQYDKLAGRWIMTQFSYSSAPPYLQCIAVSQTSDATKTWDLYSYSIVDSSNNNAPVLGDYPKLAIWPDGYYMSFVLFSGNTNVGQLDCAFDRNAMLNGLPSAGAQCFEFLASGWASPMLNSDLDGTTLPPSGSPNYLMTFGLPGSTWSLLRFHVDWVNTANTTMNYTNDVPVASYIPLCLGPLGLITNQVPCVPQPGTGDLLDAKGDRPMYRLAYRNLGSSESMLLTHSVSTNAQGNGAPPGGVRWYELRKLFGIPVCSPTCIWPAPQLFQQGTFQPNSTNRWMPSIAEDKVGDIAVGYSMSNATSVHPSVAITGRMPSDTLGTMETETSLIAGGGSQTASNRWGDYSAMTVDPKDDCTFWYTQEYYKATSGGLWNTRIASFKFPSCALAKDFSISITPSSRVIAAGSTTTYTVAVSSLSGFTGTVSLAATGLPIGATASFSPTSITGGSGSSTLTIKTVSTTPSGGSTIRVTGTGGTTVHSTDSILNINLPSITSLSPISGPVGTPVTITGTNFGSTTGAVTFNGMTATPATWTNTKIVVPVPALATTGMVQVTVNGHASNFVLFTVIPHILTVSPSSGAAGLLVTISGTTFGRLQDTRTITFNGKAASVTNWNSTQIQATVPTGATTGPVVVTVDGNASNGVTFTVAPSINNNGLTPSLGPVGTLVTINGLNFGATQSSVNGLVTINGKQATISGWTSTQIKATVPVGAATGPVVVTANGMHSNGETFTVN